MTQSSLLRTGLACALVLVCSAGVASAGTPAGEAHHPAWFSLDNAVASARPSAAEMTSLQLVGLQESGEEEGDEEVVAEKTEVTTFDESESWDLGGPYFLRSADPTEPGEMEFKFTFGYDTASDGTDDDSEFEFEFEWGLTEDIELLFGVPVEFGDGGVDGNADITLGFHTRFWKEQDWIPAVAMRNYIRVPSGYQSSGVDYEARLLITKTIIPGRLRGHINPFLKSVNGNNEEEARHFQWGTAIGVDYRLTDNLVLVGDYIHRSSEEYGNRNNHALEFGADWKLAEHHTVAFGTEVGLDGDDSGMNWGFKVMYIFSLKGPRLDSPSTSATEQ